MLLCCNNISKTESHVRLMLSQQEVKNIKQHRKENEFNLRSFNFQMKNYSFLEKFNLTIRNLLFENSSLRFRLLQILFM